MNKKTLLALLATTLSAPGYAGVIAQHCDASLGVFVGNAPDRRAMTDSVPCNLSVGISAGGLIGIKTAPVGGYSGRINTSYTPTFNETASGFTIDLSHSGNASLSVTSGMSFPGNPVYNAVGAGLAEYGSAYEFFSVDSPYTYELDYSPVEATSPTGSAYGGASLLLGDLSGTGHGTGLLVPGEIYFLPSRFDAHLSGGAKDGKTESYTASWSGSYARLTAVAVPVPGTALLFLGGLVLLVPFRFRRALQLNAGV